MTVATVTLLAVLFTLLLAEAERLKRNYIRRMFWNKAQYSLDADDGIEHDALFVSLSPCEVYERKMTAQELHAALDALPTNRAGGFTPITYLV